MSLRPATPDDAPEMALLMAEVAQEGRWIATEAPVDVDARAAAFAGQVAAGEVHLLLEQDGRLLGHGGVWEQAAGVLDLGMALRAEARGRGLGGVLLDGLLDVARAQGAHKVALEVWPDNGRAIALYVSRGFVVEGVLRDHYRRADGTLRSAVVMGRPVQRGADG